MDPNGCLIALLEAIERGDYDTATLASQNLATWIMMGGNLPDVKSVKGHRVETFEIG